jgi:hypothetical protein
MQFYRKSLAQTVEARGAAAGSIVRGSAAINHGLPAQASCAQPTGHGGVPRRAFVTLNTRDNKRTHALPP